MVTDERWTSLDGILIKYEATSSVEFLSSGTIVEIPIYSPHIVQTTTIFTISRVEIRFKRLFFYSVLILVHVTLQKTHIRIEQRSSQILDNRVDTLKLQIAKRCELQHVSDTEQIDSI